MKVLLLDDDNDVLEILETLLLAEEFEILTATNLSDAKNLYNQEGPNACIVDLKLKDESGLDFIKEVRAENKKIKLVLCSGFIDDKVIEETKELNLAGFISKPFDKVEILTSLADLE